MKEHAKRSHAKFAPSSAKRWKRCHGSIELSKNAPPQVDSPAAREGTMAHECLEFVVKNGVPGPHTIKLKGWDSDMVSYAAEARDVIYSLRPSPSATLHIETRARLSEDVYGSLDYAWVEDWGTLVVIDYKYGFGLVLPAEENEAGEMVENEQLMCYAAGIAKKYNYEFDKVVLAIIQPRVWRDDPNPLTTYTTTVKKLRAFEKETAADVAACKKPGAPLVAGDHCKFCPAAAICPEISKKQYEAAGLAFDLELDAEKLPEVDLLSADNIPGILRAAEHLELWFEKVRARALQLASEGKAPEGYKLVAKKATRSWLPQAEAAAKKTFGAKALSTVLLSPFQLEKALGEKGKKFTAKYTTAASSGYTLVKNSDKREAMASSLAFDIEDATTKE